MYSIVIKRPVAKRITVYVLVATIAGLLIVSPLFLSVPVQAVMLPSLLKARTIGELILTLFAGAGTAITNPTVIPQIYQSGQYSIEELVEEDILNLTDYPEYTNDQVITELGSGKAFNLDVDGFRNLMETNWQNMRDLQIDTVLRFNNIANTDSTYGAIDNIGGILTNVCEYGYLGFENSIAIVTNPITSVKVALSNVKDAVITVFGNNIDNGFSITSDNIYVNGYPNIATFTYGAITTSTNYMRGENGVIPIVTGEKLNDTNTYAGFINLNDHVSKCYSTRLLNIFNDTNNYDNLNAYNSIFYAFQNLSNPEGYFLYFNTREDARNYINSVRNGDIEYTKTVYSPDVIGTNGNLQGQNIETGINQGQGLDIINSEDYDNFADAVNNNTNNGNYDDNEMLYDDLIDQNINDIQEPEPEPIVPVQPTSFPTRPTITPEQTIESLKGATPGITEFFPFCIPSDLVALFTHLNVSDRQAPVLTWEWNIPGKGINETVEIDLSKYDNVATICRMLELIMFIYGLIVATRAIIGA